MFRLISKLLLLVVALSWPLQAQFSSEINYVERQQKIDENSTIGAYAELGTTSFAWNVNGLTTLNKKSINSNLDFTTSQIGLGGFYTQISPDADWHLEAGISSFNRSAHLKISGDSLNSSADLSSFDLLNYRLGGSLNLKNQPYFVSGRAQVSSLEQGVDKSNTYSIYLEPGVLLHKNAVGNLSLSVGAAIFDDNYASFSKTHLYQADLQDQYAALLKYSWQSGSYSAGCLYKFGMLPDRLYANGGYSNVEAFYRYNMSRYHLAVQLTAGTNLEHNSKHIGDPELAISPFYYDLRFEGEYFDRKLLVGVDWQMQSVHTSISDDQAACSDAVQKLNVAPGALDKITTTNDQYKLKLSFGYRL